jgi:5'(3')-deoxyribonucleotidase
MTFKTRPIALIDCDEVLVEAAIDWVAHLNKLAGTNYSLEDLNYDYNLGKFFKDNHGIKDPMEFWYCDNLYESRVPKPFAVDGLKFLRDAGFDIYVVTYCVGNHYRSKQEFIERWFGDYVIDMIATGSKHMVHGDLIVDDRDDHLAKFDDFVFTVRMDTPYKQKVVYEPKHILNSWKDVDKMVEEFDKHREELIYGK